MIRVIKGNVAYIDGVMELYHHVQSEFKNEGLNIYQDNEYPNREIFLDDLNHTEQTLIALDDNKVVGFLTSEEEKTMFEECFETRTDEILEKYKLQDYKGRFVGFARLMVDPEYRHQGIASKLLALMEKKYHGYVIIFLVHEDNRMALKLYPELHYQCLGLDKFSFGEYYIFIKNQLKSY